MTIAIRPITIWALEELADRNEQTRLWLSDGSSGEVSSFDEAVSQVFESDVDRAMERNDFPPTFASAIQTFAYSDSHSAVRYHSE